LPEREAGDGVKGGDRAVSGVGAPEAVTTLRAMRGNRREGLGA
jgi:hypothetical protein